MVLNKQLKFIPVDKDVICITCLSRGRKLYPVEDLDMKNYCEGLQLSLDDKVCWECRRTMSKFLKFTQKALRAQALLSQWIKDTKNNPLPILSNLTTSLTHNLTCTGDSKAVIENDIVVKTEPEDADLNIKTQIPENVHRDPGQSIDEEEIDIESKITVKINIESLKEAMKMPDKNPPVKQSIAKKLCAELYNNRTVLTPPLHKKEASPSQMINQDFLRRTKSTVGDTINTRHEYSRDIHLFTIKELSHNEMLVARDKMRAEEKFKASIFKCETCIEVFPRKYSLDKHNKKHSAEAGHYACSVCNQRFSDQALLQLHEKMHLRQYKCPNCSEVCLCAVSAQRHYEACIDKQVHKCKKCEKQFTTRRDYLRHKRQNHGAVIICDHCGKRFNNNKSNFVKHLLIHSEPMFECEVCKKKFRFKSSLKAHMKVHDDTKDEGAYCAECDVQFKYIQYYMNHLKTSLKHISKQDLRFPCPQCDKRFRTNAYLKSHTDAMHSNELNYSCKMCDQSFKTRKYLRKHVRRAHEGYVCPRNNILCNICGQTFTSKATCKQHMNSHTGERPYACETCGATFGYSAALYTHKTKHKRCRAMLEQKKAKGETNSETNVEQTTN